MTTEPQAGPAIERRPAVPYAGVRRTVTLDTIAQVADRIPVIIEWLAGRGAAPAGAPFLRYHALDMGGPLEVEAGVPVAAPVAGDGEITPGTLPEGRYATLSHTGHPDGLTAATAALLDWGTAKGLTWDASPDARHWGCRLEIFKTHPLEVPDPNDWTTELAIRLADT